MSKSPRFIAIVASTIDGKIALNKNQFTNWTSKEDKDFLHTMLDQCDLVIVGNNTYKTASKPLFKRNCLVLTRSVRKLKRINPNLTYCNPRYTLLRNMLRNNKKIVILGGTQVYSYCLEQNLLDEIYLTIEPIVFGSGLPLFLAKNISKIKLFKLISIKKLNIKGSILLHYQRI